MFSRSSGVVVKGTVVVCGGAVGTTIGVVTVIGQYAMPGSSQRCRLSSNLKQKWCKSKFLLSYLLTINHLRKSGASPGLQCIHSMIGMSAHLPPAFLLPHRGIVDRLLALESLLLVVEFCLRNLHRRSLHKLEWQHRNIGQLELH